MQFFGGAHPGYSLDEGFDAPDAEADYELCRAIVAGRMGLHPDAWGCHDPLPLRWLLRKRPVEPAPYERVYHPSPADLKAARHWPRPVKEPPKARKRPKPKTTWVPDVVYGGTIMLSCDDCDAEFSPTLDYEAGQRGEALILLRTLAATKGWSRRRWRDHCPDCSCVSVPPLDVDQRGVV